MISRPPAVVLPEDTVREHGRGAQAATILAARAIADAVRTVLGPRGRQKMLIDPMGDVVITNDGATVLRQMAVQHPAARMLIELSETQDQEVGDGTTSVVVLAGELLHAAEGLLDAIHPTRIVAGYRIAAARALEELEDLAWASAGAPDDDLLRTAARATMATKSPTVDSAMMAELAVAAVRAVTRQQGGAPVADVDDIQVVKRPGGAIGETALVDGVIVPRGRARPDMPASVEAASIALLDAPLQVPRTGTPTEVRIRDLATREAFLDEEERLLHGLVERIMASGANVVISTRAVDDRALEMFARAGVLVLPGVERQVLELLARATGATIVADPPDLAADDLGCAGAVQEQEVAEEPLTRVTGCVQDGSACSILLRGGSGQVIDEVERSLHDGLRVTAGLVQDQGGVVAGGGATEVELAQRLRAWAPSVGGREQLAVEAFATALEVVPRTLAGNAGLDAIDVLVALRAAHREGRVAAGIDVTTGRVEDMAARGVLDPLRLKRGMVHGATEAATMLLRVDDVIAGKRHDGPSSSVPA